MHEAPVVQRVLNLRTLQRQLATLLPEARAVGVGEGTLEIATMGADAPKTMDATVIEGRSLRAHRVFEPPTSAFQGFLDGIQRTVIYNYIGTVPVILGQAAAVIRERRNRRMHTWGGPATGARLYAPRRMISSTQWEALVAIGGGDLVDTSVDMTRDAEHPYLLHHSVVRLVQRHREQLESGLAERWCTARHEPLFIDGGISGSAAVALSGCTVGVVKSHQTLYAEGDALAAVLGLRHRERSSVFRITSAKRTSVASWYLRMRDGTGRDPMWGLVRVEIAHPGPEAIDRIGDRADEVSRWILAEASPLALPDARWDKMVYGVRDCEEFLRAIT